MTKAMVHGFTGVSASEYLEKLKPQPIFWLGAPVEDVLSDARAPGVKEN